MLVQYVQLWDRLQGVHVSSSLSEKFVWRWSPDKQCSARSAYHAFFVGQCGLPGAKELRAPPSSKFFIWTALLACCWTSERLQRHGLRNSGSCALCHQALESIEHLLLNCVYAREVWFVLVCPTGCHQLCPVLEVSLVEWWLHRCKVVHSDCRKCFDGFVVLVTWHLSVIQHQI
jgi:hypothetical protein